MTAYIRRGSKVSRARADIESLAAQGMDRQRIADAVGLSYQTVRMFAKTNGIAIARKKVGPPETAERDAAMESMFRAFERQRQNSRTRGIVWKLTFGQWFAVWQASGKLHLRGRGKGRYCMSRHRDEGGYELGNVHIQLCTTNSSEGFGKARGKPKAFTGVFCIYPGRELAWLAKVGKVNLGYFASAEAAYEARNDYLTENSIRTDSLGRGRAYAAAVAAVRAERAAPEQATEWALL